MRRIRETIVVEGKDDVSAVRKAVDANVIATHGYGISEATLSQIRAAYEATGLILFTDPDHAGRSIREKLTKLFPDAKQAYLTYDQARAKNDIGIENASPADIDAALSRAEATEQTAPAEEITEDDLARLGLTGLPDSAERRAAVGAALGVGYANGKTFRKRLNYMHVTRSALEEACRQ